jgi:hypothetical protein
MQEQKVKEPTRGILARWESDAAVWVWPESDIKLCQKAEEDVLDGKDTLESFCYKRGMHHYWLSAVKDYGLEQQMDFLRSVTDSTCLRSVKTCGLALQFVKRQTPEICRAAIAQDGNARTFVK